jgi:D-alanyl-D-alanine carboxypeptidase/D-alanyl-D-alanine-endopeptidase (penicillin-binding protein 4)
VRIVAIIFFLSLSLFMAGVAYKWYQFDRQAPDTEAVDQMTPTAVPAETAADSSRKALDALAPLADSLDAATRTELGRLFEQSRQITDLDDRIAFFSQRFLGRRYDKTGPCGEGCHDSVDSKPLCNLSAFDCVTYGEHVLALALSDTVSRFLPNLVRLRYDGGHIDYVHRNHFFILDWLDRNRGLAEIVPPPEGVTIERTVSKQAFFGSHGIACPAPDTLLRLTAWTRAEFKASCLERRLQLGTYFIVFVKRGEKGIDANHVGLLLAQADTTRFRCASRVLGRTVEQEILPYLDKWGGTLEGIVLARIRNGT